MSRRSGLEGALVAVLVAVGASGAALAAEPSPNAAVAALVRQGDFWRQKGRKDLAADAYRRALAAEPGNGAARRGLAALDAPGAGAATAKAAPGPDLNQARSLGRKGENSAAAAAYRQAFGGGAPPDNVALEYYQTLAGAPGGLAQAQAGLRGLAARRPGDLEVQLALGQVLTYRDASRREGVALLARLAGGGGSVAGRAASAWRQALVWMDDAPRNAPLFQAYLAARPGDAEIARKLAGANQPARTSAADPSSKARAEGFAALERGDLALAETRFEAAIARRASDADALGGLGLTRLRARRFAEAAELLERAVRAAPAAASRWTEALASARFYGGLQQAQAALDQGRAAEAERTLRPLASAAVADRVLAQTLLAEALRRQGKTAEAEAAYRQVLAANPAQAEAQEGLVQVLLDQNRVAEAEDLAARASALRPGAGGANALRGRVDHERANRLWANGDLSGANSAFEAALAAAPADPWVRLDFARFLAGQGETGAAQGLMAPVIAGTSPEQMQAAAVFAEQQGRPDEALDLIGRIPPGQATPALAALRARLEVDAAVDQARRTGDAAGLRALAARPDLPAEAGGRIAVALYDLGDPRTAVALAQRTLMAGADGPPASYDGMVTVLARAGHDAEAAALIRQVAARAGATPQGPQGVADLTAALGAERADRLRKAGDLANAFEVLSAAHAVAPKSTRLLAPLGRVYQDGRLHDQAIATYGALLRAKPGDKEGLIGLADASAAKGDLATARRAAAQAIGAAPRDPDLYLLSARIERQAGDEKAALAALRQARALRLQPTLGAGGAGGLDAVLAPGSGAPGGAGLGPNPFRGGQAVAPPPAPRLEPAEFAWPSVAAAPAQAYVPPGPASSYAGMAFPITGRGGQGQAAPPPIHAPPPPARMLANPFVEPVPGADAADDIDRQIAELTARTAAEVAGAAVIRGRSGEEGLSELNELSAKASLEGSLGQARLTASATPVNLDAGTPGGDSLQRFGANQIINARAIVGARAPVYPPPGTQSAAGVAVGLALQLGEVSADIGSTPMGFEVVEGVGGLTWAPRLGRSGQAKAWIERRAVTDSVIAYAGTVDPLTGQRYGQVSRTGGGASLSYDSGDAGLYGDASYHAYGGHHVADNSGYQVNLGGYIRPYRRGETVLQVGFNLNQQGYDNNQNFFSLGHGGYFSPKSFTSVTTSIGVTGRWGAWRIKGDIAPGYQIYSQAGAAYFPMDPALQTELDALATQDTDVFAHYLPESESGFGVAGGISADYRLRPGTTMGGVLRFNTFGDYSETTVSVSLRQSLGEGDPR